MVTVNKNGEDKQMEIDLDENENLQNTIKKMAKKNRCQDFFKETIIEKDDEQIRMYEKKSEAKYFSEKRIKTDLEVRYARIKLVLNLKSLQGALYLKTVLEKIEISRKLFVIAVQDGDEIYVPNDLSQTQLPISFRYYDPIIQVV